MNARNCQLCGKPLSRLRVGGDGDFCSKDHRNQFRLRAGMDRLVEVNKVASLMRRREAARQIPLASLVRSGNTARHDFGDLLPTNMSTAPRLAELRPAAVSAPRITSYNGASLKGRPPAARGIALSARTHGREPAITPGNGAQPRLTERRHSMAVSFPRHESRGLRLLASEFRCLSRDFVRLPPPATLRADLGSGTALRRSVGRTWSGVSTGAAAVTAKAAQGNALRVSIGLGFKLPKIQAPINRVALRAESSLSPVVRIQTMAAQLRDWAVMARSLEVVLPELPPRLPAGPAGARVKGFDGRPARNAGSSMLRDMPALSPREDGIPWPSAEPRLKPGALSQSASGFARRNGARPFPLSLRPNLSKGASQVATANFVPREDLLLPKIPYCNVLAAATTNEDATSEPPNSPVPVSAPVLVPPSEVVRYEEHFDGGWDNWVGGVADWKVDVAGVRTGGLALYVPTLDLCDYDLEFLARIDSRSVNWVVRAAGSESHLHCTITAVEGGQLEFSHAVVQGGVAEATVVSATRATGKPRATFTVRMSASGPIFSITIDGKTIDSWVDDRLATGGIGFVGAPDDRARLYWVRVSSPAAPSKEHTVQ
jgi:hypothetical protein